MKKINILFSMIITVLGIIYILSNTFGTIVLKENIIDFLITTIVVPAIVLILCGIIMGRKLPIRNVLITLVPITIIMFGVSVLSMIYIYHTGNIYIMLDNTVTLEGVDLIINDTVTFGTIVQQLLICCVCTYIGVWIGNKTSIGFSNKIDIKGGGHA
jgi:hypothetical protein